MPINEYDHLIMKEESGLAPSGQPLNEYDSFLDEENGIEKQQLKDSVHVGVQKEPSRHTQVMNLSKEMGLPSDVVERNYDSLMADKKKKAVDIESLQQNNPATAKWLSKPDNFAIGQDDIEPIKGIEQQARMFRPPTSTTSEFYGAAKTGWNDLRAGSEHVFVAFGKQKMTPEAAKRIAEFNKKAADLREAAPSYAKEINKVIQKEGGDVDKAAKKFIGGFEKIRNGQVLSGLADLYWEKKATTNEVIEFIFETAVKRPKGTAYITTESLAHSIPSTVTGIATAAPASAAGPIGTALGFGVGSFAGGMAAETGAWINGELANRGFDMTTPEGVMEAYSNPKLMEEIRTQAMKKGATTAGVDALFNVLGGAVLRQGTRAAAKGVKNAAKVAGKEVTESLSDKAASAGVQLLGEPVGEGAGQAAAHDGDLGKVDFGEVTLEGISGGFHSMADTAAMSGLNGYRSAKEKLSTEADVDTDVQDSVEINSELRAEFSEDTAEAAIEVANKTVDAQKTEAQMKAIQQIGDMIKEMKNVGETPGAVKEIVDTAIEGGEVEAVFLQSDDWDDYWNDKGESPAEKASEVMEDGGKAYEQSRSSGLPMEIPVGQYAEKLGKTENYTELLNKAKLKVDGMTFEEAIHHIAETPKLMEKLAQEAKVQKDTLLDEDVKEVKKDIKQKLMAAGFKQKDADVQAELVSENYKKRAQVLGQSALELYVDDNISVNKVDKTKNKKNEVVFDQRKPEEENQVDFDKPESAKIVTLPKKNLFGSLIGIQKGVLENKETINIVNSQTGQEIEVSRNGLDTSAEHTKNTNAEKSVKRMEIHLLNHLDQLIPNSVFLTKEPLKDKNGKTLEGSFRNYFGLADVGNNKIAYKIQTKVDSNGERFYDLKVVKDISRGGPLDTAEASQSDLLHPSKEEKSFPANEIEIGQFENIINKNRENYTFFQKNPGKQTDSLGFYSKLQEEVTGMDFKQMPAKDLANRIQNIQGLKKEELEWTGVIDWLKALDRKVTKEEVQAFLQQGGVQLEEVTLGESASAPVFDNGYETYEDLADAIEGDSMLVDSEGVLKDGLEPRQGADGQWNLYDSTGKETQTKYEDYTLPGGENYREVLLTLPKMTEQDSEAIEKEISITEARGLLRKEEPVFGKFSDRIGMVPLSDVNELADAETLYTFESGEKFDSGVYKASHWDQENILAHLRVKDRVDQDGKKILHIEEIQSDWHQAGRKQGYKGEQEAATQKEIEKLEKEEQFTYDKIVKIRASKEYQDGLKPLKEKANEAYIKRREAEDRLIKVDYTNDTPETIFNAQDRLKRAEEKYDKLNKIQNDFTEKMLGEEMRKHSELATKVRKLEGKVKSSIPNAPYKQSDAWAMLVFKRALRMAQEGDYDGIAWTPGDIQAERYSLAKKIGEIAHGKKEDGLYYVDVYDTEGHAVEMPKKKFNENELESYFGKGVAEKITHGEGSAYSVLNKDEKLADGFKAIGGEDLKVGGEGMKAFYDKMLPKAVEKYIKKLDKGAKLGTAGVNIGKYELTTTIQNDNDVRDIMGDYTWEDLKIDKERTDKTRTTYEAPDTSFAVVVKHYQNDRVDFFDNGATIGGRSQFENLEEFKEIAFGEKDVAADKIEKVWHLPLTDKLKEKVAEGQTLFQGQPGEALGQIRIGDRYLAIDLFKNANPSTFLHELGHLFLKTMGDDYERVKAIEEKTTEQEQFIEDAETTLKYLGVNSFDEIQTEHHEKWAESFETYLKEGKAPSEKLRKAFSRFYVWLNDVFKRLKREDAPLTDEVRKVMDRLLAVQDELNYAANENGLNPLFGDAKSLGLNDKWAKRYEEAVVEYRLQAAEQMHSKVMKDLEKEKESFYRKAKKEIKEEVELQVDSERVYKALKNMRKGNFKIDKKALVEILGSEVVSNLPKPLIYATKDGIAPEIVADVMGYGTVREMIDEIMAAPKRETRIKVLVDEKVQEKFPSIFNEEDMERIATNVVHNEKWRDVLRLEMQMLRESDPVLARKLDEKAINPMPPKNLVKKESRRIIGELQLKNLRPHIFRRMAAKSRKEAAKFYANGDTVSAFEQLRRQELYTQMYEDARDAKEALEKVKKLEKKLKKDDKKLAKTRDIDLVNAGRAVFAMFGMGKMKKHPQEYLATLKEYNKDGYKVISGLVNSIAENSATSPDEITVGEMFEIILAVEALWDLSKARKEVQLEYGKISIENAVAELIDQADIRRPEKVQKELAEEVSDREKLKTNLLGVKALAQRFESWVDIMDQGDIDGPYRKYFFEPVSQKLNEFELLRKEYHEKIVELSKPIKEGMDLKKEIPAKIIGFNFKNKSRLLGALIHSGNESNLKKLLIGRGWGSLNEDGSLNAGRWQKQLDAFYKDGTITKEDMDYVQALWDLMEKLKPMSQQANKRIYGFYHGEIESKEIVTPFGTYRGGYAPAAVDPHEVKHITNKQDLERIISSHNSYGIPPGAGGNGHTKTRADNFNAPLNLDLKIVSRSVEDVLRFALVKPAVVDASKILTNQEFKASMSEIDPTVIDKLIIPALSRADKERVGEPNPAGNPFLANVGSLLRKSASLQIMFANIVNTAEQFGGVLIAGTRIKPKYLRKASIKFLTSPKETAKAVNEASMQMATRSDEQIFEIEKKVNGIFSERSFMGKMRDWANDHGYFAQIFTQNIVDNIVWIAGYDEAITGGASHDRAVAKADADVRTTQGSRRSFDTSQMESHKWLQFFQMFMSFFNMLANLNHANFSKLIYEDMSLKKKTAKGLYLYMMGFASVAIIGSALRKAAAGGLDEDDDGEIADDLIEVFLGSQVSLLLAMAPVVGPSVMAGVNRGNSKPFDDRVSASPAMAIISTAVGVGAMAGSGKLTDGKTSSGEIRDVFTTMGVLTGLPVGPLAKPAVYQNKVNKGKAKPTGPIDYTRGLITGK